MREGSLFSIPKEIRQFFGYFAGHLAYAGLGNPNNRTAAGLRQLIRFACIDFNMYGNVKSALVPVIRNMSIYRNRSVDDYMRLVGRYLNPKILGPPPRLFGVHLRRLAQGLARHQVSEINELVRRIKLALTSDLAAFYNGVETALLFSGMVELDIRKLDATDVYRKIDSDIIELVDDYFGKTKYLGISQDFKRWNVGTPTNPIFHTLRPPITYGPCLTPNQQWFP